MCGVSDVEAARWWRPTAAEVLEVLLDELEALLVDNRVPAAAVVSRHLRAPN
jgi:hypothetical protein